MIQLTPFRFHNHLLPGLFSLVVGGFSANVLASGPIIKPGAPGEQSILLSASEAARIADSGFTEQDVRFLQDMVVHHQQAVDMSLLASNRTNNQPLLDIANRIGVGQRDEIDSMSAWLSDRGQPLTREMSQHTIMEHHQKMGMASPEAMQALANATGNDFDTAFLKLMMRHHEGALKMIKDLLKAPGTAHDPMLYQFVTDIRNEQKSEIDRLDQLSAELSQDPRVGLTAGFIDAEIAALNLQLDINIPKPPGFYDPNNPSELPPLKNPKQQEDLNTWWSTVKSLVSDDHEGSNSAADEAESQRVERSPLLSFSYTDMAFSGATLAVGSYHGINLYQLTPNLPPELISSIVCPGGQGDVSIIGNLLLMSVEQTRGRVDCGLQGISEDISEARFRGLRIFDIADPANPKQVGQVQTCRGSHTHSVVSADAERIVVYNSGTSSVRKTEELTGCIGNVAGDTRTSLFRIDVIEIPLDDPSQAKIVDSPGVFADEQTGQLAGLWRGGKHSDDSQETYQTDQCHDITVFPDLALAAGACSGNGIIFDISNPLAPKRIHEVTDSGFAYWHSATFNNEGTKVLFTDEWGGGTRPRCRSFDPKDWGANAIYDIVDNELVFRSYYKMPAPQTKQENCVAHNGSIVPVPGRDIFVQAWYQGGISVLDFTDSSEPIEIAYFDRGPIHEDHLITGGYWSTYWYAGKIYATEITRGLDVLSLLASEHLSINEIAAAELADQGRTFNPQQQFPVRWPLHPTIGLAYLDQLDRAKALSNGLSNQIRRALDRLVTTEPDQEPTLLEELSGHSAAIKASSQHQSAIKLAQFLDQLVVVN
jgi:uncharacterized protein (DUF305 family)